MGLAQRSFFGRLSGLVVLAVALGQAALLTHNLAVDHVGVETCEVCALGDRLTDAAPSQAAVPAPACVGTSPAVVGESFLIAEAPRVVLARGPPRL